MPYIKDFRYLPEMSPDKRIRVFRSSFATSEGKTPMDVDACVIITERFVVIGDTLLNPEDMAALVSSIQEELPGKQLLVVNSHADWDHTWGNCYFTGERNAPIIAHQQCRTRMLSAEAQTGLDSYQQKYSCFKNVTLQPPTITFSHDMTLYGGDLTLQLLHTPGHCIDHVAIWIPEIKLLLGFDTLEKPIPLIEEPSLASTMFTTLERLRNLRPEHILCAHGNTNNPALLEENYHYFQEIERRCRALLAERTPAEDELQEAASLIHYPFEEVYIPGDKTTDYTFYNQAHNTNIRAILASLMKQ